MSDIQDLRNQEAALLAEIEALSNNADQPNSKPNLTVDQLREQEDRLKKEVSSLEGNSDIPQNEFQRLMKTDPEFRESIENIKRTLKVGARSVGSNLIGGAAELAMLAPNLAGMLHGRPWVSPIAAAEKLFPEDWAPKTTGERTTSTVAGLMTPTHIGKVVSKIPEITKKIAPTVSNYVGKFARELPPSVSKGFKKIGNAIANESPAALAKTLPAGLAGHIAIENDAGPAGAIAASLATGVPVNYVSSKVAGIPKTIGNWKKNAALNDLDVQRDLINQESKRVFNKRVISPQEFGNEVQGVTQEYAKKQSKNFQKEYGPIVKDLTETPRLKLDNVIEKWTAPLHSKENLLEKNIYLKSPEGQDFLRLINVKKGTNYENLEHQVLSKLFQKSLEGEAGRNVADSTKKQTRTVSIFDLNPQSILERDPALSKILSKSTKDTFAENFNYYKNVISNPASEQKELSSARRFFNTLQNNRTEIDAHKNAATIRQMSIENASKAKYHGLPSSEQRKHSNEAYILKQELLHPELEKVSPETSKALKKADKENQFWQKRKHMVESLIGKENMTPEQTQKAVLSDFGEGSYHLKFTKGIAGEKASKIAEGALHVLGREGEGANIVNLYKEYKKLPKEDARIFWLGLTQETKDKVKESFDFIDKLNARNISRKKEVNPVEWYVKTPTLSWSKRIKKQLLKATSANKYSKPAGMRALKEHLLMPSNLPRPAWKTTKENISQLPRLIAKQEARRTSKE